MARFLLILISMPLFAVTGGDVLDKMGEKEQASYIAGAIDMAAQNDAAARACIVVWYYAKDGSAQKLIVQAFRQYADRQAVSILKALIRKQCPAADPPPSR